MNFTRGEIVLVDFDPALTTEAAKTRPAIIITNDDANELSPVLVVVPITSNISSIYPHEVLLSKADTGLDSDSKAQIALIRHISRKRIKHTLGFVTLPLMTNIDSRLREHLAL